MSELPGGSSAVFLDRDGTVIEDVGYPRDPERIRFLPGALAGLRELRGAGRRLVIISNQSGVGRGLVTPEQAEAVHERFAARLAEAGIPLDGAYYCLHAPDVRCSCRKPEPEMLLRAARELTIDLATSVMAGDKASDVEAGRRAGTMTLRLAPAGAPRGAEDWLVRSWAELVERIVAAGVRA